MSCSWLISKSSRFLPLSWPESRPYPFWRLSLPLSPFHSLLSRLGSLCFSCSLSSSSSLRREWMEQTPQEQQPPPPPPPPPPPQPKQQGTTPETIKSWFMSWRWPCPQKAMMWPSAASLRQSFKPYLLLMQASWLWKGTRPSCEKSCRKREWGTVSSGKKKLLIFRGWRRVWGEPGENWWGNRGRNRGRTGGAQKNPGENRGHLGREPGENRGEGIGILLHRVPGGEAGALGQEPGENQGRNFLWNKRPNSGPENQRTGPPVRISRKRRSKEGCCQGKLPKTKDRERSWKLKRTSKTTRQNERQHCQTRKKEGKWVIEMATQNNSKYLFSKGNVAAKQN